MKEQLSRYVGEPVPAAIRISGRREGKFRLERSEKMPASPQREARASGKVPGSVSLILASRCGLAGTALSFRTLLRSAPSGRCCRPCAGRSCESRRGGYDRRAADLVSFLGDMGAPRAVVLKQASDLANGSPQVAARLH